MLICATLNPLSLGIIGFGWFVGVIVLVMVVKRVEHL